MAALQELLGESAACRRAIEADGQRSVKNLRRV